jgi:SPP1 gp7 family putative phage head morphogenesis protein
MIPAPDPSELDPDNQLTDKQKEIIIAAILLYESSRIDDLLKGASKEYLSGIKEATGKLKVDVLSKEYIKEIKKYLNTYKTQLEDGYTIIQGKKVNWLEKRTLKERQQIFSIISEGLKNGSSIDEIASNFEKYIGMQKKEAHLIADHELRAAKKRASDSIYKKNGKNEFIWIHSDGCPCNICEPLGGQTFTWATVPYEQPVHPGCGCGKEFID